VTAAGDTKRIRETWWTFREVIPLLAESHRVFAVDLRGFGDSDNEPGVPALRPVQNSWALDDFSVVILTLGRRPFSNVHQVVISE
jgi:pimeloyl-ACP methyl ester carboxylesterase